MRVTRDRKTDRRRASADRRPHERPRAAAAPGERDPLAEERRLRDAGGPEDHATYRCECGYVFEADVSTSVSCPHCGSGQAW